MFARHVGLLIALLSLPLGLCADEPAKPGDSRYEIRADHDPNGIGKFYMGREIAHVMGFGPGGQGAEWLERAVREKEEKLTLLIKSLDLKPGMVVADIGAGSGVISVLMAEKILPGGKVLAVDVQQEMLDRLRENTKKLKITNVEPIKGTQKTTALKPQSVDLAIMVDVYHELEFPYEMMLDISKSLKPGGRIAFVEYRKEDPDVPIKLVHKMTEEQVKKEASLPEFSLKWTKTIGVLPWQHIVLFQKLDRELIPRAAADIETILETDDELTKLLKLRVNAAASETQLLEPEMVVGRRSIEEVRVAYARLATARLDLAQGRDQRVRLLEEHLRQAKRLEELVRVGIDVDAFLPSTMSQATYFRLDAEIWLLRERRAAK